MRTRKFAGPIGMLGLCLTLALGFACKKEPTTPGGGPGEGGPSPTPAVTLPTGQVADVPAPQAVEVADLTVAIRIKPIGQILPKLQALVKPIDPNVSIDAIKAGIGGMLNDPTLANLDQTRGLLLCIFVRGPGQKPAMAGLLPVANDQYKTLMEAQNQLVYQPEGSKTLLTSEDETGMVAARAALPQLEALLAKPMASDLSVYVNVEKLMTNHQADIDGAIQQMMQQMKAAGEMGAAPGMGGTMQILAMEINGILSVAREIKDLEFTVTLSNKDVELACILRAKAATGLADVLNEPSIDGSKLLGFTPGTGAIQGYYGGSTKGADYFSAKIDEAVSSVPGAFTPEQREKLKIMMTRAMGLRLAGAFDMLIPGTQGLNGVGVTQITDPAAFLSVMREMPKVMADSGVTDFYKKAGMDFQMSLQENVRNHKGVAIHKYSQKMTMPVNAQMPPQFAMFMQMFTDINYELAVVGSYVVTDIGTGKLDSVIEAVQAGRPISNVSLNAEKVYGKGGGIYLDLNVGRFGAWVMGFVGPMLGMMMEGADQQMAKITEALTNLQATPISLYAASGKGNLIGKLNVPVDPIVKVKDMVTATIMAPPPPVAP